jgi:uncharacterized membrane protein
MRNRIKYLFFAIIILFLPGVSLASGERVDSFEAQYNLREDGVIEVTEKITYNFGLNYRHGIYRFIPYKQLLDDGNYGYINISKIKVKDQDGGRYNFEKSHKEGNLVLKIGDENTTFTGVKEYYITYLVKGGFRYLESGDEFYWNVTGNGWDVPISYVEATVKYPAGLTGKVKASCYAGFHAEEDACSKLQTSGDAIFFVEKNLNSGQGITVAANFPRESFPQVSPGVAGSGLPNSVFRILILILIAMPIITFTYTLRHFWKWGRDPKGRGPIVVEYEPSKGLTPIQLGTLLDFRVDNKDISAEIVYLAQQGYLTITRELRKGFFGRNDYIFTKTNKNFNGKKFDSAIYHSIFNGRDEVSLNKLQTELVMDLPRIKKDVQESLVEESLFKENAQKVILKYLVIGGIVAVSGLLVGIKISVNYDPIIGVPILASFLVSGVIIIFFGMFMPARTAKGVEVKEKSLGFKKYLIAVEADMIKFLNAPEKDPKKFEEYLPYAMVFGAEKQWAKKFEGIYKGNPSWYADTSGGFFTPVIFATSLNSFSGSFSSGIGAAQASSGSGVGGGGFSGGGSGGGGGGSW